MKITGYRCLRTFHDWGRPVGDVNGFTDPGISEIPIVGLRLVAEAPVGAVDR